MKSWIMGLLFVFTIVVVGIIFSSGFAANNSAPDGKGTEIPQTNTEDQNMISTTIDSLETEPSADKNVSASALTCTITNSGEYVVDIRLKNPGIETRTITIDPSGTKMELLPGQTKRFDLHLGREVSIFTLLTDDGTELQFPSPPCTTAGSSGSGVSFAAVQESLPPPPVPELSPLVLTLVGITGLLLVSRIRKN
jgi:archaellum component FlaF (FlaF/FlaG flagellin family)